MKQQNKTISPSIMVADLHSSISKEPGVKTGGVRRWGGEEEKRRGPRLPQRHGVSDGRRSGRVHVANALAKCEPPQTALVKQPPGGRGRYGARERGGGGIRVRVVVVGGSPG